MNSIKMALPQLTDYFNSPKTSIPHFLAYFNGVLRYCDKMFPNGNNCDNPAIMFPSGNTPIIPIGDSCTHATKYLKRDIKWHKWL